MFFFNLTLPFKDPVLIFSLVLFIILLAPLLLKKLKIPSIVGLIIAGVIIGPNGFNILLKDASIDLFGTVGLLYIMFIAGLELDLNEFKKKKNRSIVFGILTFIIPFMIGIFFSIYVFNFSLVSAILFSIMFSTHTLVAYPIVSKLGITKNEAVTVVIGGTIITDTAVLLVLSIVEASTKGQLDNTYWLRLIISVIILLLIVFWGFPRMARWFFKNMEAERSSQFIFVLALVFLAAFLAQIAGVEPIIGAFLAGLALNSLIPGNSALMNRLEFVGNSLFIPFFLIGVGMIVDFKVFYSGTEALIFTTVLIAIALFTKWLAAFITQLIFRFSKTQRKLIFGLSSSHAAAALAVVLIGYKLGYLNANILNGTIFLILISCLLASFITENAARSIAITEGEKSAIKTDIRERLLVSVSNPINLEKLIDFAILLKDKKSNQPIYTLAVVDDNKDAKEMIVSSNNMLEKTIKHASASENKVEVITRIDFNVASGIARTAKEKDITDVIIGWNVKSSAKSYIFGTVLDKLLENCNKNIFVCKFIYPLNTNKKIITVVPPNAELEPGFNHWLEKIVLLSKQIGAKMVFFAEDITLKGIQNLVNLFRFNLDTRYNNFNSWETLDGIRSELTLDDLLVIINARNGSISYNIHFENILKILNRYFIDVNAIIIYPDSLIHRDINIHSEGLSSATIQENIERFSKISKAVKKSFKL